MTFQSILTNQFSGQTPDQSYVDTGSHLALVFDPAVMGIAGIVPRGLLNLRENVAAPAVRFLVEIPGVEQARPLTGVIIRYEPWCVSVEAALCCEDRAIQVIWQIAAQATNCYRMSWHYRSKGSCAVPQLRLRATGKWAGAFTRRAVENRAECALFAVSQHNALNERLSGIQEDWCAAWCWKNAFGECAVTPSQDEMEWSLDFGNVKDKVPLDFALEMENRPWEARRAPFSEVDFHTPFAQVREGAQQRILSRLERVSGRERPGFHRELRAAMILERCAYRGGKYGRWNERCASFCLSAGWASTAFFWDSVFGALGLNEFSPGDAEAAIETLFAFQRPDGCVPTHAYEYAPGSTFLPQAPILSWGVSHLFATSGNVEFVRRVLPRLRAVFDWYTLTQDHDRDGLAEIRFSGQLADNAPQYDDYVAHVQAHSELWNIFLPPIASVALNSFLYAEARYLAGLYRAVGKIAEANDVLERVAAYPELLQKICYDPETNFFHDFDHNTQRFNRCRVLTSLLPVWAGMALPQELRKKLIEENLLAPTRFGGDLPFPYVARDDVAFDPQGYWRGRIWPHTATWMLELLWQNGYEKEADAMAGNLLCNVFDREEVIRENYYSGAVPGGGSPDFQWSSAVYLYLTNCRYRRKINI